LSRRLLQFLIINSPAVHIYGCNVLLIHCYAGW